MFTIIRPNSREEWLKYREGGIGSSEVASILGLNPFETPYQLWRRKIGMDAPKQENFAMRAGHYLEDAVAKFYHDATGKEIIKASASDWLIRNVDRPYLQVSPDRTYWIPGRPKSQRNKGILECKTTQMEVDADHLPKHWFCQLHYQLGVAELEQGAIAWLTMGRDFGYKDIDFDKEFFKFIVEQVEQFWRVNILEGKEPIAISVSDVLLKHPQHIVGKSIMADDTLIRYCSELKEIKAELDTLNTRKKEVEDALKMAMGDAEAIVTCDEFQLATWRASRDSKKFNEKAFAEAHPELYQQYIITQPGTRRLNLK